jgi:O-antigen ligase
MTQSRGEVAQASSALRSTAWPRQPSTLGRGGQSSNIAAKSDSDSPAWRSIQFILFCCLLLMVVTFSPSRDEGVIGGSHDSVALLKMAVRAVVFCGLSILIFRASQSSRTRSVFFFLFPWIGFASWAVLSTAWSPLKSVSVGQAGSFAILVMLAFALGLTVGKTDLEQLLKRIVQGLLSLCVLLLVIFFARPDWNSLSRSVTGLLHATNGSATASIGIVVLVACRLLFTWNWTRSMLIPGLIIFTATLVLAQSRTALAITVLLCAGLATLLAPPLWRAIGMAAFGLFGVLYLTVDLEVDTTNLLLAELSTYLSRGQTLQQMTELSGREEMWTAMWNSFLESPWIGHGYFVCHSSGELYVWYSWGNWTAHNFWLQILVTTGVIGCCWMGWALIQLVIGMFLAVLRGKCEWQLASLMGVVMVWQVGWGINNESFAGPLQPESVVFLVLVGLVSSRIAGATTTDLH